MHLLLKHHEGAGLPARRIEKWTWGIGCRELEWTGSGLRRESIWGVRIVRRSDPRVRPGKPSRTLCSTLEAKPSFAKKPHKTASDQAQTCRTAFHNGDSYARGSLRFHPCVPFRFAGASRAFNQASDFYARSCSQCQPLYRVLYWVRPRRKPTLAKAWPTMLLHSSIPSTQATPR